MGRFATYGMTALGILALSVSLSLTGLSQTLASGVQAGVQKVMVTNTVLEAPAAPTDPVQFGATVKIPSSQKGDRTQVAYTVPAGKRLVIEFVAVQFFQQASDEYSRAGFSTGGPTFPVPLFHEPGVGQNFDFNYVGSERVKVYANPGTTVTVHAMHDTLLSGPDYMTFSFSGYLVNAS